MDVTVEDVPAKTYVILAGRAPLADLMQVIPARIEETGGWVFANGGPAGAPMARVGMPDDDGAVEVEVGWPVTAPADPPAPLELVTYDATRAVVHQHVGPYEELMQTYRELSEAIAVAGLKTSGPARESYETNPQEEPDPQKWITSILWPID